MKLGRAILSLTVAGFVYFLMLFYNWLFLSRILPFEFIIFLIPPIITGFVASKIYSKGILGVAFIGLLSPFFLYSTLSVIGGEHPLNFMYFFANPTRAIIAPVIAMLSALYTNKEFRDKARNIIHGGGAIE